MALRIRSVKNKDEMDRLSGTRHGIINKKNLESEGHYGGNFKKRHWPTRGFLAGYDDDIIYRDNKVLLFTAVMSPILAYGCPVWGYAAKTNINILDTLQNSTIRMILDTLRENCGIIRKQTSTDGGVLWKVVCRCCTSMAREQIPEGPQRGKIPQPLRDSIITSHDPIREHPVSSLS
ncbi:hypothetical protein TNCV_3300011 [Trichonephila clavipes]|nr:hypothetical protein TNCV_3300011 [Trichonephila clavipes]